ncbi:hypothetical protein [Microbacterium sp. NPDC055599]
MNVQREIDAANRRIRKQIDASARTALIRIGVDVEAMDREEAERRQQVAQLEADRIRAEAERQRRATAQAFEELGASFRAIHDHFAAIGAAFARGFSGGAR